MPILARPTAAAADDAAGDADDSNALMSAKSSYYDVVRIIMYACSHYRLF